MTQRSLQVLLVAVATLALASPAAAAPHVVMISIDGLRPEVYRDPARLGLKLPNLAALARDGTSADRMLPVFPTVTYPAHTSLVTGTRPAEHGIVTNFKQGTDWYLDAQDIQSETLWQAAERAGLSTAIVTWPASYGAQVDQLVPENLSFGVPNLPELIRKGTTPGLWDELEPVCGPVELPSFDQLEAGARLDEMTTCFAAEVIRAHKPDLLLVHFLDADHLQHYYGPNSREAMRAFEQIDAAIGELITASRAAGIADETVFVIVGDHGFVPLHTNLNLSALLHAAGFAELTDGKLVVSPQLKVAPLGGSAAVYLADPADTETGARLEAALRKELDRRYAGLVELISAGELARMGAFPGALFGLAAAPGYMLVSLETPEPTLPTGELKGMHGYRAELPEMATGFVAQGPGIRKGLALPLIRQIDVAPTLAQLLGLRLDAAVGVPIVGIFDAPALAPAPEAETATGPAPAADIGLGMLTND